MVEEAAPAGLGLHGLTPEQSSEFLEFFAAQSEEFYSRIQKAVNAFVKTGELPDTVFGKTLKRTRAKVEGKAPPAYTIFVKETMPKLKAAGEANLNPDFRKDPKKINWLGAVAAEWKKIPIEERDKASVVPDGDGAFKLSWDGAVAEAAEKRDDSESTG